MLFFKNIDYVLGLRLRVCKEPGSASIPMFPAADVSY